MTRSAPIPHGVARAEMPLASVRFTKAEAFAACQALADADRILLRAGRVVEAAALGDLFELFEERLAAGPRTQRGLIHPWFGSNSIESELTQ